MTDLLHETLRNAATAAPDKAAIVDHGQVTTYAQLAALVEAAAAGLRGLGIRRGDRVAVLMPKQCEEVVALFAALRAGAIAVPINALLKAPQIGHILRDCGAAALVTTSARIPDLLAELGVLTGLNAIVAVGEADDAHFGGLTVVPWSQLVSKAGSPPDHIDVRDPAMIFYTSGSTGKPKGVVVSQRNLMVGARSVAAYLECDAQDRVLAVLSLSFDYGFNQLATTFLVGATIVLLDYRLPQEVLLTIEREHITGLAGVPPIWIQLAALDWPPASVGSLRYITNSGGAMPRTTLDRLQTVLPKTRIYLMYGLTEAFRSTYLPPEQLARRPDSIGKAIPDAEVLVLRANGEPCAVGEPGELVHRGPLVALGYWNDRAKTARRFRPVPGQPASAVRPELEVWSGDTVRKDEEGFLYFIGRQDDMIKTSGYRLSPTEIEEEAYATGLVGDAVAIGAPHERLGQGVVLVVTAAADAATDSERLQDALRRRLPRYMLPLRIEWRSALPRNPNGKYDRAKLRVELQQSFANDRA
jgi:acyl-CoA ligase (AMP-forming) (exosortase A-associated)